MCASMFILVHLIRLEQSVIFDLSGPILLAVQYGQPDSDLDGEPGRMIIFISRINIQLSYVTPNPKRIQPLT